MKLIALNDGLISFYSIKTLNDKNIFIQDGDVFSDILKVTISTCGRILITQMKNKFAIHDLNNLR